MPKIYYTESVQRKNDTRNFVVNLAFLKNNTLFLVLKLNFEWKNSIQLLST